MTNGQSLSGQFLLKETITAREKKITASSYLVHPSWAGTDDPAFLRQIDKMCWSYTVEFYQDNNQGIKPGITKWEIECKKTFNKTQM